MLILGYEKLDSERKAQWNFNGRLTPTHTPLSTEKIESLNDFERKVYELLIEPENYLNANAEFFGSHVISGVEIKLVHDITTEKYVYPIEIQSATIYLDNTSHLSISDKVLTDIRNKQAYLVFVYHREGEIRHRLSKFNLLLQELNLPKENVILIHGDYDVEYYNSELFTYVPVNSLIYWLAPACFTTPNIVDYVPNKLYLNYNRILRPHRVFMLSMLHKYNLYDQGLVSCGDYFNTDYLNHILLTNYSENEFTELLSFFEQISNTSPDDLCLTVDNPAQNLVTEHYTNTLVSLVAETLTDSIFFSEKIYKPIIMGHPFILLGACGQLEALKRFGFKTFDKYWSEKYDTIDDCMLRVEAIADILDMLSKKSVDELIELRQNMIPILQHNKRIYAISVLNKTQHDRYPIVDYLKTLM